MKRREAEWKSLEGPESDAEVASRIGGTLEALPLFAAARTVLLYSSLYGEVPTGEWIRKWSASKRIVLPKVKGDILELREYSPSSIVSGYLGIVEPSDEAPLVGASEIDLAIVPGVAFDSAGGRLGHGRGFYDRLLPQLKCCKIGVALPFRIVGKVPSEERDVKMDLVLW